MGFKIQCISATIRPTSTVQDHNYLNQQMEVEVEMSGTKTFEDLFFRLWELVDGEDIDSWLRSEGYIKQERAPAPTESSEEVEKK